MRGKSKYRFGRQDVVAAATFALLAFAILLGGASRQHELRLALVELAAIPLAVLSILALRRDSSVHASRTALGILAAVAALPLIQLLPLPPALWTSLSGRDQLSLALSLFERSPGWLPLSLTPDRTWRSFLALLPPAAMFLALLVSTPVVRLRLVQGVLAAAVLSVLFGAAQLASGGEQLYLWATTDAGSVTGFFANRNHQATLILIGMPFAMVLGASSLRRGRANRLHLWMTLLYVGLAVVALAVIRSRAGIVLFAPTLGVSILAAWVAAGRGRPRPVLLALVAGAAAAVCAVAVIAGAPLISRFDTNASPEGRFENWPIVATAAETYLPLGSGLGSFNSVYRSVEPLERLDSTYFNQAHNDYLETWLEAGWLGAALIIAFMIWYGRRTLAAWRSGVSTQRNLQRAASIAVGVVLLHSAVDYPLRTAALAVVFALCCGLLELAARGDDALNPTGSSGRSRRPS